MNSEETASNSNDEFRKEVANKHNKTIVFRPILKPAVRTTISKVKRRIKFIIPKQQKKKGLYTHKILRPTSILLRKSKSKQIPIKKTFQAFNHDLMSLANHNLSNVSRIVDN